MSLRDLSRAMGRGFSTATLNLAERGVITLPKWKEAAILEAIDRLASLSECRKRIIETARAIDFSEYCDDIRGRAARLHSAA